jgi:GNAT superfamily N-acetyltransferase
VDELVSDAERILRECFASFTVCPGAELLETAEVFGARTDVPVPFFSGIARTTLEDASTIDRVKASFQGRHAAFRWWLTPSVQPANLETLLLERGFRHVYDARGMVADLGSVAVGKTLGPDVSIRRVTSVDEFEPWLDIFLLSFARPPQERAFWRQPYEFFGFGADARWAHYVGFLGDTPVSTTSVLMAGDLAGIYNVATIPAARGRGVGRAVTLAAMEHGKERGAVKAVLQSSEMGYPVYRSIGYEDVCFLRLYDWRPEYESAGAV